MRRFSRVKSSEIGRAPGLLVEMNNKLADSEIEIIEYNGQEYNKTKVDKLSQYNFSDDDQTVTWINIIGLNDIDLIKKTGEIFGLHSLTLEDIINTRQRPKKEDFDNYMFIVLDMLNYGGDFIDSEQVSIILAKNWVISFQEHSGDNFDQIRERIAIGNGQIRNRKADYLVYALLDSIVDNYFSVLEKIEEQIEKIDEKVLDDPGPKALEVIQTMKQEIIFLKKTIWPLSPLFNSLLRIESSLIRNSTDIYLRDIYDHVGQIIDEIEVARDMLGSMLDIYLVTKSNRMNEVMKVLTIISTIFIPLTFIVGVYGMNFSNMPELSSKWGYPTVWIVMVVIAVVQLIYFKWKNWL